MGGLEKSTAWSSIRRMGRAKPADGFKHISEIDVPSLNLRGETQAEKARRIEAQLRRILADLKQIEGVK